MIDSQSVKASGTVGAATSGFDGGKKIKGRKRHLAVDSNGWLLVLHLSITVIKRTDNVRGFVVVPRRWVVERRKPPPTQQDQQAT